MGAVVTTTDVRAALGQLFVVELPARVAGARFHFARPGHTRALCLADRYSNADVAEDGEIPDCNTCLAIAAHLREEAT